MICGLIVRMSIRYLPGIESAARLDIEHLAEDEKEVMFALMREFDSWKS